MKLKRILTLAVYVFMILILFSFTTSDSWHGFGVDSFERVYIGEKDCINVLENNEIVHTIAVPPHRAYYFTVQSDDTILIATEARVYVVDYYGNELSCKYEENDATYIKLQFLEEVNTENGSRYLCRTFLGRRSIENENGEVIYEVPFVSYLASIVTALPFALIATVIFLSEWDKIGRKQNGL